VLLLGALCAVALHVSPWPGVLLIRAVFDRGAAEASAALAPRVPGGLDVQSSIAYDPADRDALLDIYKPASVPAGRPTIVWFHGGGFVSGRRGDVANYLKILAGRGFAVVNVDYTIAPEAVYPTPVRQASRALAFLAANAGRLGIDASRFVLAGDSAGAQIAAQTAAVTTDPGYAKAVGIVPGVPADRLAGALLFCGVYDISRMGEGGGILGWFVGTAKWAYGGRRDGGDAGFATMSVAPRVTARFPPAFVTAGNADPLEGQSVALAAALKQRGVPVDALFFARDHRPPLGHEYQFDLGSAAGREALEKAVAWAKAL
jgi:acetyl esterase/lipase